MKRVWSVAVTGAALVATSCLATHLRVPPESPGSDAEFRSSWSGSGGRFDSASDLQAREGEVVSPSIRHRLRIHGVLRVIVSLKVPSSEAPDPAPFSDRYSKTLSATQEQVIGRLLHRTGRSREDLSIKTFSVTPAMALQIDEQVLDALLADPVVSRITEDVAVPGASQ